MDLQAALLDPFWKDHEIGKEYILIHRDGKEDSGWKIAYYPLFGTYKDGQYIAFNEPRALIEKPMNKGIDFREVSLRYLK